MAQYIGQFQNDKVNINENLVNKISVLKNAKVKKLGLQLAEGRGVKINNLEFRIGKTGMLEFDDLDMEINNLSLLNKEDENILVIPCIIDFILDDGE